MNWKLNGEDLLEVPEGAEGFVYLITYSDGTKYVGKKSFWSRRRKKIKGKIRRQLVTTESTWESYRGSSSLGKEKAEKGMVKELEVLHLCSSKGALLYLELLEMVKREVLCDPSYLNANILLRIYKCYKPMDIKGK